MKFSDLCELLRIAAALAAMAAGAGEQTISAKRRRLRNLGIEISFAV